MVEIDPTVGRTTFTNTTTTTTTAATTTTVAAVVLLLYYFYYYCSEHIAEYFDFSNIKKWISSITPNINAII